MKFAFLLPAYHIYIDRVQALAEMLVSGGHKVHVFINREDSTDGGVVPITISYWHHFKFEDIDKFNPDLVVTWNGYFPEIYAATVGLRRKYRIAVIEMGWLPQLTHSYILPDLAQTSPLAAVPYQMGIASKEKNQELLDRARKPYDDPLPPTVKLPRRYAFLPMQMEYDTQIIFTSPIFKTMNSFIYFALTQTGGVPIVVRNHPREMEPERPKLVKDFTHTSPSFPLMVRADAVIGINSTMLSEAVLFVKPVYIYGQHVCKQVSHFFPLEEFPNWKPGMVENCPEYKDKCEYRSLVLLANQYKNLNPEGWVIDSLVELAEGAYTPRVPE